MDKITSSGTEENFRKCVKNISKNLEHPFQISGVVKNRFYPDMYSIFIDVMAAANMTFDKYEITSTKNYRRLHALIKARLIRAVYDLHEMTGESLRSLGALEKRNNGTLVNKGVTTMYSVYEIRIVYGKTTLKEKIEVYVLHTFKEAVEQADRLVKEYLRTERHAFIKSIIEVYSGVAVTTK